MHEKSSVDGEVTRVKEFGLYVRTAQGDALVLIPDVSRDPIEDLNAAFKVGDRVRVRLLRFVPDHELFKATMILDEEA